MRMTTFGLAAALTLASGPALTTQASEAMLGNWARDDGNARARMAPCGDSLCMTNTWIRDPDSGEKPGHRLVLNVRPAGENRMTGEAFDPQRNLRFSISMSVAGDRLETSGCMVGGLICKGVSWTRIK